MTITILLGKVQGKSKTVISRLDPKRYEKVIIQFSIRVRFLVEKKERVVVKPTKKKKNPCNGRLRIYDYMYIVNRNVQ